MKLNAQLDVAQKPTGSAVPTTDIVQPPLMTAQPKNSFKLLDIYIQF